MRNSESGWQACGTDTLTLVEFVAMWIETRDSAVILTTLPGFNWTLKFRYPKAQQLNGICNA